MSIYEIRMRGWVEHTGIKSSTLLRTEIGMDLRGAAAEFGLNDKGLDLYLRAGSRIVEAKI